MTDRTDGYGTLAGYFWGTPCRTASWHHVVPVYLSGSFDFDSVVVGGGSLPPSTPTEPCFCGEAS